MYWSIHTESNVHLLTAGGLAIYAATQKIDNVAKCKSFHRILT